MILSLSDQAIPENEVRWAAQEVRPPKQWIRNRGTEAVKTTSLTRHSGLARLAINGLSGQDPRATTPLRRHPYVRCLAPSS